MAQRVFVVAMFTFACGVIIAFTIRASVALAHGDTGTSRPLFIAAGLVAAAGFALIEKNRRSR